MNVPLDAATATNLSGIILLGNQKHWKDEGSQNYNLFMQYQVTKGTTLKAGYVGSQTRHALVVVSANTVGQILPPGTNVQQQVFYPHFGQGGSIQWAWGTRHYNGLQVNLEHRSHNLFMLG